MGREADDGVRAAFPEVLFFPKNWRPMGRWRPQAVWLPLVLNEDYRRLDDDDARC
jgi:hypothetical protein